MAIEKFIRIVIFSNFYVKVCQEKCQAKIGWIVISKLPYKGKYG